MIKCIARLGASFLKLFCMHRNQRYVFQGKCYFRKGNRERVWCFGTIHVCERCGKEIFSWNTSSEKLTRQITN
jgi:hypothetical protein